MSFLRFAFVGIWQTIEWLQTMFKCWIKANLKWNLVFYRAVYLKAESTLPVDNIGQDGAAAKERRQTAAYVSKYWQYFPVMWVDDQLSLFRETGMVWNSNSVSRQSFTASFTQDWRLHTHQQDSKWGHVVTTTLHKTTADQFGHTASVFPGVCNWQ